MIRELPYRSYNRLDANLRLVTLILVAMMAACNQNEQRHINHQPDSAMGIHNSMKHDSDNNSDHTSHDIASHDNSDTNINETYWNTLPTNRTVIARQKVVEPISSEMNFSVAGNGYITFDLRRNRKVPVRVAGRIEKLYVKYNYQYVRKGEKILDLYSPELSTYVEEYLYVLQQTSDTLLRNRAKQKLLLLGLTSAQIKQFGHSGGASITLPIYSPFEGYVLFNPSSLGMNSAIIKSGDMGGSMGGANGSSNPIQGSVLSDNSIREGMYVSRDQTLFWMNDFKEAWGIVAFTKENEKYIRRNQPVTIKSELSEKPIQASIQLIEQVYQGGQKFTQARVYIPNTPGDLKQNSLITVEVPVPVKSLMVPASSVYYLGKTAIVWVQVSTTKDGHPIFQSRAVKVGYRGDNKVAILEGLAQNEKIAKDAGYLVDSEAIIQD